MTDVSTDGAGLGELIRIEPVFLAKVWGGTRLRGIFRDRAPEGKIGECLAVSARPEGDCSVRGGRFDGATLSELWAGHRELFGGLAGDAFPLQVKILDAADDLSVQVHPDALCAAAHPGASGKNECWYVLSPSGTGRIVAGHYAGTREEFARMAVSGRWAELLRTVEMKEGDFFLIPAGTVHAILAGSLIYEVQQASDTTYRLFDYDRLDGAEKRELHLIEALEAVSAPSLPVASAPDVTSRDGAIERRYVRTPWFSVSRWDIAEDTTVTVDASFLVVGVLAGSGTINGAVAVTGDHFLVPSPVAGLAVTGSVSLMVTRP
jgi:mannose-6-phosphate isomerase